MNISEEDFDFDMAVLDLEKICEKYGLKVEFKSNGEMSADLEDERTTVVLSILEDVYELKLAISKNEALLGGENVDGFILSPTEENTKKLVELNKKQIKELRSYEAELKDYEV